MIVTERTEYIVTPSGVTVPLTPGRERDVYDAVKEAGEKASTYSYKPPRSRHEEEAVRAVEQIKAAYELAQTNGGSWQLCRVLRIFLGAAHEAVRKGVGCYSLIDDVGLACLLSEEAETDRVAAEIFAAHLVSYAYKRTKPSYWMRDVDPVNWWYDERMVNKIIPREELLPEEFEVIKPDEVISPVTAERRPVPNAPIVVVDDFDERLWRESLQELNDVSYAAANYARTMGSTTHQIIQAACIGSAWKSQPIDERAHFADVVERMCEVLRGPVEV